MTDSQFHELMKVLGLQLGMTIGVFVALLFVIYNTGKK